MKTTKWKIAKLEKEIAKKKKELAILRKKVKNKELELAGSNYDLNQLTKKGN